MIGVTIGVGKWRQMAELAAAAAHKHTGLAVRVLGDSEWERYRDQYDSPAFLKLHLFDLVDDDDVFYFDADAIHINAWNPRQFAGCEALTAVIDPYIGDRALESGVPRDWYFNSGMMILNRQHHRDMLLAAQGSVARMKSRYFQDQPHLNRARMACQVPLHALEFRFNHLRFYSDPQFSKSETVIAHWTPHDGDLAVIEEFGRTGRFLSMNNAVAEGDSYLATIAPYADQFLGRGIVICAGGMKYLPSAWVLIRMLRHLGCQLPIQVWYRGKAERDESWMEMATRYDVQFVDAEAVRQQHPHLHLGGWELKAYAVLHSPFREVLLLDADNVPVRDPEYLFETPAFLETGAVFWPDGHRMLPSDPCWRGFGVDYRDERNFESGQLLIDKRRCWREIQLCNWYNEHSYFYYRLVYGDKDTFRFAWHRLGTTFAMPDRNMGQIPCTLLQYDPAGELIFQHRCGDKWRLSGNTRIPQFQHEELCHGFLQELRRNWNPVLGKLATTLTEVDRARIKQLAGNRFQLVRPGYNRWSIELAANGFIAKGWSPSLFLWWIKDDRLVFAGDDGAETCRLSESCDGNWEGRSMRKPSMVFRLTPQPCLPV